MRCLWLFLRCRRVVQSAVIVTVIAALIRLRSESTVVLPALLGGNPVLLSEAFLYSPFLGVVIALALHSDMASWERIAARPLWPYRLATLSTLVLATAGLFLLAVQGADLTPLDRQAALRAILALAGTGSFTTTVLGSRFGWIPPLLLAIVTVGSYAFLHPGYQQPWWNLALHTGSDARSWGLALLLFLAGARSHTTGVQRREYTSADEPGGFA